MDRSIDSVALEVIKSALTSVADELALVIMRTAYSNIVRDAFDFSSDRISRSLGAFCVATTGCDDCDELEAMLAGWDGQFSVLIRKRVARHVAVR